MHNLVAILSGALFVLAIICGIGPQNLNIITHAIKKNHSFTVSSITAFADISLLLAGGIGLSLSDSKTIIIIINIIGIVFMCWYLMTKVRGLFGQHDALVIKNVKESRKKAVIRAFALTFLNPLVLIDMIVIIGATSSHYHGVEWVNFIIGAILGDLIWVFGITFIAQYFSKQLNRVSVWITLDVLTILIMLVIIYKTILFLI